MIDTQLRLIAVVSEDVSLMRSSLQSIRSSLFSQLIFLRLLALNKPEWLPILIACMGCLISGATQSISVILLHKITNVSTQPQYKIEIILFVFRHLENALTKSSAAKCFASVIGLLYWGLEFQEVVQYRYAHSRQKNVIYLSQHRIQYLRRRIT